MSPVNEPPNVAASSYAIINNNRAEIEGNAAVGVCHGKRSASVAVLDAASDAEGLFLVVPKNVLYLSY